MVDDNVTPRRDLVWAFLLTRLILGLIFFLGAWWRVFDIGPVAHAERFFVTPFADSWLPTWALWVAGVSVPFMELTGSVMLLLGVRIKSAAVLLGCVLVIVTFGHFVAEPLFSISDHIFPRLVLVLTVLILPVERDWISLDRFVGREPAVRE